MGISVVLFSAKYLISWTMRLSVVEQNPPQGSHNPLVAGSSPAGPIICRHPPCHTLHRSFNRWAMASVFHGTPPYPLGFRLVHPHLPERFNRPSSGARPSLQPL